MLRLCTLALLILMAACTGIPKEYGDQNRLPTAVNSAVSEKMSVVGSAVIGRPTPYLDEETGLNGEIVVDSEYFSANGRLCRRYTERQSSFATPDSKLGCQSDQGWIEIKLDTFAS